MVRRKPGRTRRGRRWQCRALVRKLGEAGFLQLCVDGDVRSLAIARATLATIPASPTSPSPCRGSGRARSGLFGTDEQKSRMAAEGRERRGDRRLRPDRAGRGTDAANIVA